MPLVAFHTKHAALPGCKPVHSCAVLKARISLLRGVCIIYCNVRGTVACSATAS